MMKKDGGAFDRGAMSAVAFDRASGEVLHVHHFYAMPGAALPSEDRIWATVMRDVAEIRGRRDTEVGVLLTEASELPRGTPLRVDPKTGRLDGSKREHGPGGSFGVTLPPR
jgi:hypothetical protein